MKMPSFSVPEAAAVAEADWKAETASKTSAVEEVQIEVAPTPKKMILF